jgi:hypothetical protein
MPISGPFGNVSRGSFRGPGLVDIGKTAAHPVHCGTRFVGHHTGEFLVCLSAGHAQKIVEVFVLRI